MGLICMKKAKPPVTYETRYKTVMNPDAYSSDNLLRYHVALSFVDQLEAEGFLASGDKAAMYALVAEKYGIEKSSIFAV